MNILESRMKYFVNVDLAAVKVTDLPEAKSVFYEYTKNGMLVLLGFRGRKGKPFIYNGYKKAENRQKELDYQIKMAMEVYAAYNENLLNTGDVLSYQWGYEQTNVEFFQVVGKTAKSVKIRKISKTKAESADWATAKVMPNLNNFVSDQIQSKRVKKDFVSMEYGVARKWDGIPELETYYA